MTNKVLLRLRIEFVLLWVLAVALVVLNECDVLPQGMLAGDASADYLLGTLGIAITIVPIPLILKYHHRAVLRLAADDSLGDDDYAKRICRLSEVRLGVFCSAVLINLSVYYATMQTGNALCALMALFASLFCWPNEKALSRNSQL